MHIKKDDVPLVSFPHDELWIAFRNQPAQTMVWLSAVTSGAVIEIWSGKTEDVSLMALRQTVTLTHMNHIELRNLVGIGVERTDQFVRLRPTAGRIEASVVGPGQFRHYMKSLIT